MVAYGRLAIATTALVAQLNVIFYYALVFADQWVCDLTC
jgi:hypothetical protein